MDSWGQDVKIFVVGGCPHSVPTTDVSQKEALQSWGVCRALITAHG